MDSTNENAESIPRRNKSRKSNLTQWIPLKIIEEQKRERDLKVSNIWLFAQLYN